jgi:subtilisin family serine protease
MPAVPTAAPHRAARLAAVLAVIAGVIGGAPATSAASPAPAIVPSDELYAEQTALQPDASIGAPEAWKVTTGAGVVVAVLDTGVDPSHPDLRGALWTNPGETPGNGRDDDANGYVDDVHGVDLVNGDGDPADDEGHGTHVAGIIAARADGEGVVGLAPGAVLMPVKVLDDTRAGNTDTLAEGIRYALAHGAQVINVSANGPGASTALRDAVRQATSAGVSIVASAGNGGIDLGLAPSYPASYPDASVLAVGATDGDNLLASFSNFGRGVALTAPGVAILSTGRGNAFELRSGTSMAAPEVSASLALLRSARPDLPDSALREALLAGARHPGFLASLVGGGALDVAAALHRIVPEASWPSVPDKPVLEPRVKRRGAASAARARTLVTWTLRGDTSRITGFRLTRAGGKVVARRRSGLARGAWVAQRRGVVTVSALAADGSVVTLGRVRLR